MSDASSGGWADPSGSTVSLMALELLLLALAVSGLAIAGNRRGRA